MKLSYNATGEERKSLVTEICRITGDVSEYQYMPTCAYKIGDVTVDKTGTVFCEDEEKLRHIEEELKKVAFVPSDNVEDEKVEEEKCGLTIEVPLDKVSVGNLSNILQAKGTLIRHALGISDLGFEIKEDRIAFPWFSEMPEAEEAKAYTDFISKLCKLTKELKRASSREMPVTNEKYTFRCFLLRLGFIGSEYKKERKILLENLSGNSSWKNGAPETEVQA
ncbi:MAG: virulence protein [Eubacterium sp.]|jgi:hypothetical protein|nr:virulence protein [Eubacterium sp.]MCH4007738.1 virulence protein [Eubacterium sp.]MCH4078705.1 virulence protein [Eubacterium sp.]MCH4078764.1 virulence protein [Eubacterium sp.]MCH4109846.1 virulence protein [Eubacterium sp.]